MSNDIHGRLANVRRNIRRIAVRRNRSPDDVGLLAVSKTFPAEQIKQAYRSGQRAFGENYVDEALAKMDVLTGLDIEWHYIGNIQSNKTRKIAEKFHWVHSLVSLKQARRLSEQRPPNMPPLNACIQINVSGEPGRSGIDGPAAAILAAQLQDLPGLYPRGIMGIPANTISTREQQQAFSTLASVYHRLRVRYRQMDTLSMGMSGDMEAAIAEGSTIVRIGTAIFGERQSKI